MNRISKAVRAKESLIMTQGLAEAVLEFHNQYKVFPEPAAPGSAKSGLHRDADTDLDTSAGDWFVKVLAGEEHESPSSGIPETESREGSRAGERREGQKNSQNPEQIDFIEGIKPAKLLPRESASRRWVNGRYIDAATGRHGIVDSWGTEFRIRLDTDNNNQLANPNPMEAAAGRPMLPGRVIVWCAGKDGDWNTWDDNIQSWN